MSWGAGARRWRLLGAMTAVWLLGAPVGARAAPPPPPPGAPETAATAEAPAAKQDARAHFELGLSHFDAEEWEPALAEFLRSRELFPTKNNTKNAAICLRKVGRFDEALSMFEALLREFPDLTPTERALVEHEQGQLEASVGTLGIEGAPAGASVTVDSVARGAVPLRGPLRLAAGTHLVRVTLEGTLPFEARVELSGRQALVLRATLVLLTRAGRLRVTTAARGPALDLSIDGAHVGTTPWEGALAPGPHTLSSSGPGLLGTAPARVLLVIDQLAQVSLSPAELRAEAEIDVTPAEATLAVDGVPVGAGGWRGRLPAGTHTILATLGGFAPAEVPLSLRDGERRVLPLVLRPSAPLRPAVALELDASVPLGAVWGGDVLGGCGARCSAALPVGGQAVLRAAYDAPSGLGVGAHVGYLLAHAAVDGRAVSFTDVGLPPSHGTSNDDLWLQGLRFGGDLQYLVRRGAWPVRLRLGLGALVATLKDDRSASGFVDAKGATFSVQTAQKPGADYLYAAPEVRLGRRLGPHLEVSVGVEVLLLGALKTPEWTESSSFVAGGVGAGTFPTETLTGSLMVLAAPSIGLRYEP